MLEIKCAEQDLSILVPQTNDLVSLIYDTAFKKGDKKYPLVLNKKDVTIATQLVMSAMKGKSNTQEYRLSPDRVNGIKRSARLIEGKLEFNLNSVKEGAERILISQNEIKRMLDLAIPNKNVLKSQLKLIM